MDELYRNGEKHLEPTRQICKIVFTSWLRSDEDQAPARAENFLRWMSQNMKGKEHPEDYASLLRCWARSRHPESGVRAEKLLQVMFQKFGRKSRIIRGCLSDLVCASARANDLERAEGLLFRMCDDYVNNRTNTEPDTRAFVAVLAAISRNKPPGAGTRSLRVVQSLREILSNNPAHPNKVLESWNQSSKTKSIFSLRWSSLIPPTRWLKQLRKATVKTTAWLSNTENWMIVEGEQEQLPPPHTAHSAFL